MPSTVLVLGAAGRVGQLIAKEFAAAGWQVRAQARKALPMDLATHAHVAPVHCDATDLVALHAAAQNVGVVVNALNPLYTEWDRLALPLADAALATARHAGALLMLPGNVYNYGRELPPLLTAWTPERGDTPKARLRIEMEARLSAAAGRGVDSVVIRAGDFFGGPGTGTWLDLAIATKLARGRITYPGDPGIAHAWAYLPDLARTFVRVAAQRERLRGHRRLNFAGHTLTGHDLAWALEAITGRTLRMGKLPWPLIRLGARLVPMWRELLVMRYLWDRPHALDDAELRALIGPVPHTPLPEALRSALDDMVRPSAAAAHRATAPGPQSPAAFFNASARS